MTIYEPSLETESREYQEFVGKFKTKKTTDDCYTPDAVYDVVRQWAIAEYELQGREIVRPFWPGSDYRSYDYPNDCVVIDNPPFSIMTKIVRFYNQHEIDYFLFSPSLTNFSIKDTNHVLTSTEVIYQNGASVNTSFVTNLGEYVISTPPDLYALIKEANKAEKPPAKQVTQFDWPDELCTAAGLSQVAKNGVSFTVKKEEACWVRNLDQAKAADKAIYGSGFLLSHEKGAEKRRAIKEAQKRAALRAKERKDAISIGLSRVEQEIVERLGKGGKR